MGFKLEDIKLEEKGLVQEIKGIYDFGYKESLSGDRTFCFFNASGCGCDYDKPECKCNSTENGGDYYDESCQTDSNRHRKRPCSCVDVCTDGFDGQRVCRGDFNI